MSDDKPDVALAERPRLSTKLPAAFRKGLSGVMDVQIRRADFPDLEQVGLFARFVWERCYANILSPAQIEYMLLDMYTPQSLSRQLDSGHEFWLIEAQGTLAGFISVQAVGERQLRLHKLYVDPSRHAQGFGYRLLQHILRTYEPRRVTLHVNRHNDQAILFYVRNGFVISGRRDTDIGGGFVMEDFVMQRTGA